MFMCIKLGPQCDNVRRGRTYNRWTQEKVVWSLGTVPSEEINVVLSGILGILKGTNCKNE